MEHDGTLLQPLSQPDAPAGTRGATALSWDKKKKVLKARARPAR